MENTINFIEKAKDARKAIAESIYNYRNLSDRLKEDPYLLVLALSEIEQVRYCCDQWDFVLHSSPFKFRKYFCEAAMDRSHENQVTTLMNLIIKGEGLDSTKLGCKRSSEFKWGYYD